MPRSVPACVVDKYGFVTRRRCAGQHRRGRVHGFGAEANILAVLRYNTVGKKKKKSEGEYFHMVCLTQGEHIVFSQLICIIFYLPGQFYLGGGPVNKF